MTQPAYRRARTNALMAAESALARIVAGAGWKPYGGHGWWVRSGASACGCNTLQGALRLALRDGSVDAIGDDAAPEALLGQAILQLEDGAEPAMAVELERIANITFASGARALVAVACAIAAAECERAGITGAAKSYRDLATIAEGERTPQP